MSFPAALTDLERAICRWSKPSRVGDRGTPQRSWKRARDLLVEALNALGFHQIGDGVFSVVLARGDWVVKIVQSSESPASLAYLHHCVRHHPTNSLLPRIMGLRRVGNFTLVISERLDKAPKVASPICRSINRYIRGTSPSRIIPWEVSGCKEPEFLRAIESLNRILHKAQAAGHASDWDVGNHNVLFRPTRTGPKPVLNDPISY